LQKNDYIFLIGDFDFSDFCSGPQKVSKNLFFELSRKYNVRAYTYYQDGSKYSYFQKLFKIEAIASGAFIAGIFPILINIIRFKPKIIHITGFRRFTILALLLKRFLNYKLFYTVNGIVRLENKYFRKESKFSMFENKIFEKLIFNKADDIFYLSDDSLQMIKYYFKSPNASYHLIENGIEKEFYDHRKTADNLNEPLRICFSANVNKKEKGFDFFADCMGKLQFPITLIVFSDDEIEKKFNDNVKIVKYNLKNTTEYIKAAEEADIIISSSNYENFNLSLVEMMAMGKVPVVTKQTGASRFITDGVNGFTFNYGDSVSLIKILNDLNQNRDKLKLISEYAMKIYDTLSWEKVITKYENVYDKYLIPDE